MSQTQAGHGGPWAIVRRQQDRRRYLRVLALRQPDAAHGVPRSSHLLTRAPATMIRTSTHYPDPRDVRHYVEHSCDVTMRGGVASSVAYPLAVCALAEHYVLRRVAGASGGAAIAAAAAAAELGRGAADPPVAPTEPAVVPGFAGLAALTGWLAGHGAAEGEETWRLARMFQPAGGTRATFRLLAMVLRWPLLTPRQRRLAPVAAILAGPGRQSRLVLALVWLGFGFAGFGMVASQVRAAQATPGASVTLALVTGAALAVALAMAAVLASLLVYALATAQFVRSDAEAHHFGLVPGVRRGPSAAQGSWRARVSGALDRWSGVPEPGDVPPLVEWLADRVDDLAGVPATVDVLDGPQRHALTFGDLWLGEVREHTAEDVERLAAMAVDAEQRVVDLALVTTNLSQRRPHRLPFPAPEVADRTGGTRYLFCVPCLLGVLPQRVVDQMTAASPAVEVEHVCPRHTASPGPRHDHRFDPTLRELPDAWDLPVVAAARMSMATPGLLRAVPLYSVEVSRPAGRFDEWGARLDGGAAAPEQDPADHAPGDDRPGDDRPGDDERRTLRTHWFCDGGVTSNVPITFFDTLLPRWPTFGLSVAPVPDDAQADWLDLPPQDASTHRPTWREVATPSAFASALVGSGLDWRDTLQAELPGLRGRVASVRQGAGDTANPLFLRSADVLHLALRGYHAGVALRERFTGRDGTVAGQTQTDRHRWIRMRTAVRELKRMSVDFGARMPLFGDLAASYRVPAELTDWFDPPLAPGDRDRAWADMATAVTTLRTLSTGGFLDVEVDDGAPPLRTDLGISPPE